MSFTKPIKKPKQVTMKLYLLTEKYIKDVCRSVPDVLMYNLIPIELPSEQDIEEKSTLLYPIKKIEGYMSQEDFVIYARNESFKQGVKWMKEQILNQKK